LLTFVPHPTRRPVPNVAKAVCQFEGAGGNDGSSEGASSEIGRTLKANPRIIGKLSRPGWPRHVDKMEDMPKTRPLCSSRPEAP
jgi:hypothetical protein